MYMILTIQFIGGSQAFQFFLFFEKGFNAAQKDPMGN